VLNFSHPPENPCSFHLKIEENSEENSDEMSPSFLMVLTAVGGAYKRDDGVYVAPINMLRP
jgi:hypothetical protein